MSSTIPIVSAAFRYDVVVRPGLLAEAGAAIAAVTQSRRLAIVTDSNVGPLYAPALRASLTAAGFQSILATLPPGESHKTLADLAGVYNCFLEARIERSTPILALGGGIVGDMAGFVAATMMRGVPFIQMPTTLLAMVDASVGGKTGVNHPVGKNLIGAFHQPIAVFIDPAVLQTLPSRELHGGLAECIKHDCIRDAGGFAALERDISRALSCDIDYLSQLVAHNVVIKARVVEQDPLEKGPRAHLNFGHTFAHAIETVSGHSYTHGQAVALGMVAAAHLSQSLGLLDEATVGRIRAVIARAALPTGGLKLDSPSLMGAMASDKKVADGRLRLVLLDGLGKAVIRDDVTLELVRAAIESLRK